MDLDLDSGKLEAVEQGDPQRAAVADLFHDGRQRPAFADLGQQLLSGKLCTCTAKQAFRCRSGLLMASDCSSQLQAFVPRPGTWRTASSAAS